jgi:hypothetical protein
MKKILTLKAVQKLEARARKLSVALAPPCPKCKEKTGVCSRAMVLRKTFTRSDWKRQQKRFKKVLGRQYVSQPYVKRVPEVNYICIKCKGDVLRRPMTATEIGVYHASDAGRDARTSAMFAPWHAFHKKFANAKSKTPESAWKFQGWDFIKRIERYIESVSSMELLRCDDSVHAGSRILVVHHELPDYYWGTSFLYIPQCTGEPPTEFFFYDNHARGFLSVMKKIVGKHLRKGERS